jgi:hypothetical protein
VSIAAFGVALAGSPAFADADHQNAGKSIPVVSVGPQYDTAHVYVASQHIDAFVDSFIATFGGQASQRAVFTVTPTPSKTASQYVQTPVGMLSVFAFQSPIPYPFGREMTGYQVADLNETLAKAQGVGVKTLSPVNRTVEGRTAMVEFPGGYVAEIHEPAK